MTKPFVSISIPVYNVKPYLKQCLNSVLRQTYTSWECVLVDDGSTDGSGEICDEYAKRDSRFKVVHKKNAGLAAARQTGLENISGKYVVNIDSDDWVEPMHVENMVAAAEENQADIVICPYYENTEEEEIYIECKPSAFDLKTLQVEVLEGVYHAGVVLKLFNRDLFKKNPIQPAPYSYYEDMFTYLSCLQYANKVIYIPKATYHYRFNTESLTNMHNIKTRIRMYEECMLNLSTFINLYDYSDDKKIMRAVYMRANQEKGRLLKYLKKYYQIRPYLLNYFPESPSLINVVDYRSWAHKNILCGRLFPLLIFKLFHYPYRKIKELFSKLYICKNS